MTDFDPDEHDACEDELRAAVEAARRDERIKVLRELAEELDYDETKHSDLYSALRNDGMYGSNDETKRVLLDRAAKLEAGD